MSKNAHRAAMRTLAEETLAVLHEIRDRMPEPDCTCEGNPRCKGEDYPDAEGLAALRGEGDEPGTPQDAPAGRIGWLRVISANGSRYLVREVEGGWSCEESDLPDFRADHYPDAVFTPIATLPEGYVAVDRDDLCMASCYLDNAPFLKSRLSAALERSQS